MLKSITLKNFTVFGDETLSFSPGINVFVGSNSTGKTHAMKIAYSLLKFAKEQSPHGNVGSPPSKLLPALLAEKISRVFRPDDRNIGRLVRRSVGKGRSSIALDLDSASISCEITSQGSTRVGANGWSFPSCLFLPAREVLSIYPGFLAAYQARELAFDETYYDLCLALSAAPLRGRRGEEAGALWKTLGDHLGANVVLQNNAFYLKSKADGTIEAHLAAEGYRKIASLMHLIANGSLMKNGVLFWDEPESNLNPILTRIVAKFLQKLASNGIQVVVATHDYLLTNELSLDAEYRTEAASRAPLRFFCFTRGEDRSVTIQQGETLGDIVGNPIMGEFEALYDRERRLFSSDDRPIDRGD